MFFFKDLNVSGRRIFFNDFGYYIVFGIKVLGVLIFGKNKVRFEKKIYYYLMLGCYFFYIEKNIVRFFVSLFYLLLIY